MSCDPGAIASLRYRATIAVRSTLARGQHVQPIETPLRVATYPEGCRDPASRPGVVKRSTGRGLQIARRRIRNGAMDPRCTIRATRTLLARARDDRVASGTSAALSDGLVQELATSTFVIRRPRRHQGPTCAGVDTLSPGGLKPKTVCTRARGRHAPHWSHRLANAPGSPQSHHTIPHEPPFRLTRACASLNLAWSAPGRHAIGRRRPRRRSKRADRRARELEKAAQRTANWPAIRGSSARSRRERVLRKR